MSVAFRVRAVRAVRARRFGASGGRGTAGRDLRQRLSRLRDEGAPSRKALALLREEGGHGHGHSHGHGHDHGDGHDHGAREARAGSAPLGGEDAFAIVADIIVRESTRSSSRMTSSAVRRRPFHELLSAMARANRPREAVQLLQHMAAVTPAAATHASQSAGAGAAAGLEASRAPNTHTQPPLSSAAAAPPSSMPALLADTEAVNRALYAQLRLRPAEHDVLAEAERGKEVDAAEAVARVRCALELLHTLITERRGGVSELVNAAVDGTGDVGGGHHQ